MPERNIEINIDGMIGPTHHFGGLGVGNIASHASQNQISNPREAALEGLAKMERVAGLGVAQYYLPPPTRPNWQWLETIGYSGDRRDLLRRCYDESPRLLSAAYSSAFMWTANAATVAPASDTSDGRLHLVPSNLCSNLHRGQEAAERRDQLRQMFREVPNCDVHEPLPSVWALRDEGAANHMRLCGPDGQKAIHLFVYGQSDESMSAKFFSRQSEQAARSVARRMSLRDDDCVFVQQTAQAIDAGVFHNDVIAMSNGGVMIYHELAFENSDSTIECINQKFERKTGANLFCRSVNDSELPIAEAVRSYLFNSQLISVENENAGGDMELICPTNCCDSSAVSNLLRGWIEEAGNPIRGVRYMPLGQSMKNGGGPACLRLRVMLSPTQLKEVDDRFMVTEERLIKLRTEVNNWYPGSIELSDLARLDFAEHVVMAAKTIASLDCSVPYAKKF
ncbi:MAG: N-succinylarginine dihydrolase [Planctomycetota bacterium]|nr:N-succinylarginine dihydrolase [Planctomycetota bacterium]